MSDEYNDSLYDRLLAESDSGGSVLEPLVRGFEERSFRNELQEFIAACAPAFSVVCEDGSHPLAWTTYHNEYKAIFERKLTQNTAQLGISEFELPGFCAWLEAHRSGFLADGGVASFLEAMTACMDYEKFLSVMFAEVGRQAGEEIDVAVPEGFGPGQALSVTYLGTQYNLVVPDNCGPGSVFRIAVQRPADLSGCILSLPDQFYGLD
eukprot:gnl/TRDRNA2_/TRDRNA2_203184_c0_seq1.p1 gnl/TRDRNA2_/TRDRNA2_203184_c0~~gnl/TRDRNA2_/TRDRNA2_203184_c0_seq1.p1  ORF type:complete len:208 (-),score=38.05 gnl/TRDRNA2_/TRDRNA2_203184_c0_seq1:67-690(-)